MFCKNLLLKMNCVFINPLSDQVNLTSHRLCSKTHVAFPRRNFIHNACSSRLSSDPADTRADSCFYPPGRTQALV